jgi:hypothetical protein
MNDRAICEVMLYAYKDLERMCDTVEAQVWRVALGSINNNVYDTAEKIIRLNNEKIAYCNIKVIIDEALKQMKRCDEIKAYHIDGLYYKDVIKQEAYTERTYWRRLQRQREKLYQIIIDSNKAEDLQAIISDSRWLTGRYNDILKAQNQAVDGRKVKE